LAYDSEFCTLINFLFLVHFAHVDYQIQLMISSYSQECSCSWVHLDFVRNRDSV